jgi:glucose/arabinose dehydrogenase
MSLNRTAVVALIVIAGALAPANATGKTILPAGFVDEPVVAAAALTVDEAPARPTAIAWLPATEDHDLLIAEQSGVLFRANQAGETRIVLDLREKVCASLEFGLLGLAVDPGFAAGSRFIYLSYTESRGDGSCTLGNRAQRVSRFTVEPDGTVGNEEVLIHTIRLPSENHAAGDLQFDRAGRLYFAAGDGVRDFETWGEQNANGNARRLDVLNGKILRIEPDGSIPLDNPFTGPRAAPCHHTGGIVSPVSAEQATQAPQQQQGVERESERRRAGRLEKQNQRQKQRAKAQQRRERRRAAVNPPPRSSLICQEIYATGLRNPFRIAFDPDDTGVHQRFYINDVGNSSWEEIDLGMPGADYGFNIREGPCPVGATIHCAPDGRFVEPVFAYVHDDDCRTITGGAFVPNDAGWPEPYRDAYLFADYACGKIFALRDETPGQTPETFADGMGAWTGAIHLAFGPDDALYYTTFADGGQVRRIVYTAPPG